MAVMQQMLLASGALPVSVSYIGHTAVVATTDTQSQSGVGVGPEASDRYVFIIVNWQAPSPVAALASASIGGVPARIHANVGNGTGASTPIGSAIISALVPTGTSTTVVLTYVPGSLGHISFLETYHVTGLLSDTPIGTIAVAAVAVQPYSDIIDVKKDGLLLFGGMVYSAATNYIFSGTVIDYDISLVSIGSDQHDVGSSLVPTADQLGFPVSISRSGGGGTGFNGAIVGASFR